ARRLRERRRAHGAVVDPRPDRRRPARLGDRVRRAAGTAGPRRRAEAVMTLPQNRRRQARLWIAIASIPVVLLALALVGKWLSMYVFAQGAIAAHVQEDGPAGVERVEGLEPFNWFEEWKAPYDKGVALADADRLADARASLEQALGLAT